MKRPLTVSLEYLSRHWHGELSLPVSFWVNGLLLTLLISCATRGLDLALNSEIPEWLVWGSAVASWTLIMAAIIWQVVGTWRSASRLQRSGGPFWPTAAKLAVPLVVISNFLVLNTHALAQLKELVDIAVEINSADRYSVQVLPDGANLEITGTMSIGLTDHVQKLIATSEVKTLHLNTLGGRVGEARALRDLIERRSLNTHTATDCYSSCIIAFMAGKERSVAPNARLGFHRYSFPGIRDSDLDESINVDRTAWEKRGVSAAFIDRAFATPSDGLWIPSAEELLNAGVITQVPSRMR